MSWQNEEIEEEDNRKVCPFQPQAGGLVTHFMKSRYVMQPYDTQSTSVSEGSLGFCYEEGCMAFNAKTKDCRMFK